MRRRPAAGSATRRGGQGFEGDLALLEGAPLAIASFPTTWIGTGIPDVRDCDGTYCETSLDDMPTITVPDDLSWLVPLHPAIDEAMRPYRPDSRASQAFAQSAKAILTQAEELKLHLPTAFKELIQSEELRDRFPSATACYFDLPESIVPIPFGSDGYIVRFLNDQQICVLWYLYLPTHGAPSVLASYPVVEGADFLEQLDAEDTCAVANASHATRIVARTFSEFLYRYWIENNIWFRKSLGLMLTSGEIAYIRRA